MRMLFGSCLGVIAGVAALPSQSVVWSQTGTTAVLVGDRSVLIGDRNGDGFDDFITMVAISGQPWQRTIEFWPVSGRDGTYLPGGVRATSPSYYSPVLARVGDMDGDGVSEYATFTTDPTTAGNTIAVRSGRDDRLVWSVTDRSFGRQICGDVDLNGDGHPDLVIGSPFFRTDNQIMVGCIWAFDHRGTLLYHRVGGDPRFLIGGMMAGLGDVDGDGCGDFVMAVFRDPAGATDPGHLDVVSGRTGMTIRRVQGAMPGDGIAAFLAEQPVAAAGDVDGDGVVDFMAGGGVHARGTVQVFSTRTGQLLHAWYSGGWNDGFGRYLAGGIDFDRDGVPDIIASEPLANSLRGVLHIWSGRDWSELFRFTDTASAVEPGVSYLMTMPPQPGDVFPRVMVAMGNWRATLSGDRLGRHYLLSGAPRGAVQAGAGCLGTLGREPLMGLSDRGAEGVRVTVSGGEPGGGSVLVLGSAIAQPGPVIDLGALGFIGCALHPLPQALGFLPLDPTGYAQHRILRPLAAAGTGLPIVGQWVVLGTGSAFPGAASAALRWSIQ